MVAGCGGLLAPGDPLLPPAWPSRAVLKGIQKAAPLQTPAHRLLMCAGQTPPHGHLTSLKSAGRK